MSVSNRLKKAIEESEYTFGQLGTLTGIAKSSLQRYASGDTRKIPIDAIERVAPHLGVSAAYLMGWDENPNDTIAALDNIFPIEIKKFPLIGTIACGEPIFAEESFESYIEAGANIKADFCLRCKGDSMINARICDGDIVFIRKQSTVNNGEIAAVIIGDEATLKRVEYSRERNLVFLKAENPKFETLAYSNEELNHIRILGKAVAFQSDVM